MTHPHDLALLYDLLDGRIAPSAAEELRKRLAEEPELVAAWDELKRMREGLRALPVPPVPRNFLESVKARAGIAASSGATRQQPGPPGPSEGDSARTPAEGAPAGKVFRMRPWAYAAAAGVCIVAGVAGYLVATRPQAGDVPVETAGKETARDSEGYRRSNLDELGAAKNDLPKLEAERAVRDDAARLARVTPDAPAPPVAPPEAAGETTPTPRFGAPGGAIPPNLRRPSDSPAVPRPASSPPPVVQPPAPPAPTPPPVPDVLLEDGEKDALKKSGPGGTLSYVREGVDDVLVFRADTIEEARAQVSLFFFAPVAEPASRFREEWKDGPEPVFERYTGAPVVLLRRATGDAVAKRRGETGLPDANDAPAPQAGLVVPPPPATPPPSPTTPAAPAAGARADKAPSRPTGAPSGPGAPAGAGAVPPETQTVLGSFFLELSPAQWARATARIDEDALFKALRKRVAEAAPAGKPAGGKEKGDSTPAKPVAAPPVPAPSEPAMGEDLGVDAKSAKRRVRVLVLPTR